MSQRGTRARRGPWGSVAGHAAAGLLVLVAAVTWPPAPVAGAPSPASAATAQVGGETSRAAAMARATPAEKLDLNSASLEAILALPISEEVARAIYDHREYVAYFQSVYDLTDVDGVTPQVLATLKPLVETLPPAPEDASISRLSASYRQVRRYLGQEGSSEGLVDEYLDQLRDPQNVNELDLFDLMSYQNVSPVDAVRILETRERLGAIENARQLRQGPRYWAYRNLRDFVVYSEEEDREAETGRVRGDYQLRFYETPYYADDDELSNFALTRYDAATEGIATGRYLVGDQTLPRPALTQKLRLNLTSGLRAGFLTNRYYGEVKWNDTTKGYVSLRHRDFGPFHLKRAVFGHYRAAFGLGLVMDNTDFIHFRKTGYGWNKRLLGVRGDLSRTREYALRGGAVEGTIGPLHATVFASSTQKDAILNDDGTVNRYVLMIPRPEQGWLDTRNLVTGADPTRIRRGAVQEDLVGGNLKWMVGTGTFVGVSGYEARYDRGFRPLVNTLVINPSEYVEARDAEIGAAYNSVWTDPATGETKTAKYRRVLGAEFQTVVENVALQAEYALLQDPQRKLFDAENPDAYVINAYTQWEDLNLLAIYRDYDVGYENPYNRAFSNDSRYEQTILDAPYRLNDDLYSYLELNDPQPKSERGLFLDARYRISRELILTGFQFDQWTRKADGADLARYTIKGEYQPIFNLRFRVRHRYSSRTENSPEDVRTFSSWETRWQLIALLSNYNRLAFTYMTSNVHFPARQRLSFPAEGGDINAPEDPRSAVGLAADPGKVLEVRYEHNVTPWITISAASTMYDGFFWNFEGNEFVLLDGVGYRHWLKFESRISQRLLLQLKVTHDHNRPRTFVDVREFGVEAGYEPDAGYVPQDDTFVRVQLDYTF